MHPILASSDPSSLPWWSPVGVVLLLGGIALAVRAHDRRRNRARGETDPSPPRHEGGEEPRLDAPSPPV